MYKQYLALLLFVSLSSKLPEDKTRELLADDNYTPSQHVQDLLSEGAKGRERLIKWNQQDGTSETPEALRAIALSHAFDQSIIEEDKETQAFKRNLPKMQPMPPLVEYSGKVSEAQCPPKFIQFIMGTKFALILGAVVVGLSIVLYVGMPLSRYISWRLERAEARRSIKKNTKFSNLEKKPYNEFEVQEKVVS